MHNRKTVIYRLLSAAAVIILLSYIFYLSAQPAFESVETSSFITRIINAVLHSDIPDDTVRTFAHGAEYALLGFLLCNLYFSFRSKVNLFICVPLAIIYALSDEIHQIFVPGRAFQLSDIAVDSTGALIGALCFLLLFKAACALSARRKDKKKN